MKQFREERHGLRVTLRHPWRTKEGGGREKREEKGEQTREPVPGSNLNWLDKSSRNKANPGLRHYIRNICQTLLQLWIKNGGGRGGGRLAKGVLTVWEEREESSFSRWWMESSSLAQWKTFSLLLDRENLDDKSARYFNFSKGEALGVVLAAARHPLATNSF